MTSPEQTPEPADRTPGPDHRAEPAPAYDPSRTSPKVSWAALAGAALIVIQAVLTTVTPEMFDWAGEYTNLVYTFVTALGMAAVGWLAPDPARTGYTREQAARTIS